MFSIAYVICIKKQNPRNNKQGILKEKYKLFTVH